MKCLEMNMNLTINPHVAAVLAVSSLQGCKLLRYLLGGLHCSLLLLLVLILLLLQLPGQLQVTEGPRGPTLLLLQGHCHQVVLQGHRPVSS